MTTSPELQMAVAAEIDGHWNFGDPAKSEAAFRALLAEADAAEVDRVAQIETQLARSQGLQCAFDAADATLDSAAGRLDETTPLARVRYLLERGRVRNSSGEPTEAAPLFVDAHGKANEIGADFYAVDAAHMLGIVTPGEAGQDWNRQALERAAASADPRARGWAGSIALNMGWWFHGADRPQEALAMFEQAVDSYVEHGRTGDVRVAVWSVARCLRTLGEFETALARQEALRGELETAGESDGYVHEEIGECLLALDRAEEARPSFALAHEMLSQDPWLAESEPGRIERLGRLAGVAPDPA